MGLKRDVVVVNEFSVPKPGGKGSRGATPGSYVERYMAREQATESLAPIQRRRTDDFIMRYMARESAVEKATSPASAKAAMRQAQGQGGVAFGYGQVSLSDEQLHSASKDIQSYFDKGHTVLKTVLSFDEDYLKRHGIVDEDFHCEGRGDYRGHLDQMKLRMAIMRGLSRMASGTSGFDDLRYVGVIQVDTEHVHCHLAMVDAGRGHLAKDGTQRGKLLDRHKSRLRRGIDSFLDEKQAVAHLSSAVGYERRNVVTFIKRWAHETMRAEALPQFLIACLPEDRTLWRAGSNDRRMRKANELVTELVLEQLERAGSPMPAAMETVLDYANGRREREDLSTQEWRDLVEAGRRQIVERATNGVYTMLRALPPQELTVRTPMLEVMSMDDAELATTAERVHDKGEAEDEDLISFGFRLRSYASRLQHHTKQAATYRDLAKQWEKADAAGAAAEESRPLYDFYRFETDYQSRLMSKYQHFLPYLGDENQFWEREQEVAEYGQRLLSLRAMREDASLQRMKDADQAERLGRQIYDQPGGRLLTQGKGGRQVLDERLAAMGETYDEKLAQLRSELADSGLILRASTEDERAAGRGSTIIEKGARHLFDDVKALDLHHLGYDFFTDVEISPLARRTFLETSESRRQLLLEAMAYLDDTNQSESISSLPVDDVAAMVRLRPKLEPSESGRIILPSRYAELRAAEAASEASARSKASRLDAGLVVRVRQEVDQAARTTSAELSGRVGELASPADREQGGYQRE